MHLCLISLCFLTFVQWDVLVSAESRHTHIHTQMLNHFSVAHCLIKMEHFQFYVTVQFVLQVQRLPSLPSVEHTHTQHTATSGHHVQHSREGRRNISFHCLNASIGLQAYQLIVSVYCKPDASDSHCVWVLVSLHHCLCVSYLLSSFGRKRSFRNRMIGAKTIVQTLHTQIQCYAFFHLTFPHSCPDDLV